MRPWLRRTMRLLPLLLLAGLAFNDRKALASSLVQHSRFQAVAPSVYVDPGLSAARRAEVLRLLEAGRARVGAFYGGYTASPRVIAGEDLEALAPFGRCTHACTHYSPLGLTVVLGPQGFDEEVVSHELAHAELFARLGWWRMLTAMPTWFDEGLAMQFDGREAYGEAAYRALEARGGLTPLDRLGTAARFFDEHAVEHYVQVRHQVGERLRRAGAPGVLRLIDEVSRGEPFHDL